VIKHPKKKSPAQLDREIAESLARRGRAQQPGRLAGATKKRSGVNISALIASDDPAEWDVARDMALQEGNQKLIVQLDMARALDVEPSRLHVVKGRPYNKAFEVRLGGNSPAFYQEYVVVPDEDTAEEIALTIVKNDLDNEPSLFGSFIDDFINEKALKKWVYDARLQDDYVDELARHQVDDFWDLAKRLDVDAVVPDTAMDGNLMEPTQRQLAAVKKAYASAYADNPMRYFEDMYSHNEAVKQAINAVGIDIKKAAEAAVKADGWQHFLATYDGNSETTDSGLVYWRVN
jgi:hypothetical protein